MRTLQRHHRRQLLQYRACLQRTTTQIERQCSAHQYADLATRLASLQTFSIKRQQAGTLQKDSLTAGLLTTDGTLLEPVFIQCVRDDSLAGVEGAIQQQAIAEFLQQVLFKIA